ncbi:MAG: response regulator [Lachnospiraceae bacterium]|nr:response regulator [Lachnospiraceae bacterium]
MENTNISMLVILISYTVFGAILIIESLLMGWEIWVLPLIAISMIACWIMHIARKPSVDNRILIYSIIIMMTFFFYGIHPTSFFDMAPVAIGIIVIYAMAGEKRLIYLMMAAYYLTFIYDVAMFVNNDAEIDTLIVSRCLLHVLLVLVTGRISVIIINRRKDEVEAYGNIISELEETNRRTEDFLTNVSHELRTPINAVTGITGVIMKRVRNEEIREEIRSVKEAGNRLLEQVTAILDYTEIDTGRLVVSNEEYMITSVINDIFTEKQVLPVNGQTELVFDVDADIPAVLEGDGEKIKKILKNVIGNGVKFTKKGGVRVRISARKKTYGINLCIDVEDTGIGISAHELERIRDRFYQVNSGRSRRAGGLGLGLSIVYGIVRAMGGFVRIESKEGEGTKIHISIPQKVVDRSPSMFVENRKQVCLVCFIRLEKYDIPRVREYYQELMKNLSEKLGILIHYAYSKNDLEKLDSIYNVTHVFVDAEEYTDNAGYLEKMTKNAKVIVVCNESFELPTGSRAVILHKPFYTLGIVNMLNTMSYETSEDPEGKRMVTPGVRALVVDDENMNLIVAKGIFSDYGMSVTTVTGGLEAIRKCEEEDFDIIFLDHMMPDMDGVETLHNLRTLERSKGRTFTIVALTANAVSGAREMFLSEGFDGFVPKPIEYSDLERVLKRVLPKSAIDYISRDSSLSDNVSFQTSKEDTDPVVLLERVGIDTQSGIRYCRNDREFYLELLDNFVSEFEKKKSGIGQAYENKDLEDYHIRVHALKSTARMLGAAELSEYAKNLEEAAKKNDEVFIGSHHEELMNMYSEVVEDVADCIGKKKKSGGSETKEIGRDQVLDALARVMSCIETYEVQSAEDIINGLSGCTYEGSSVETLFEKIKAAISDFDMKSAATEASGLLESLKGGTVS